jgi:hypothetical protein
MSAVGKRIGLEGMYFLKIIIYSCLSNLKNENDINILSGTK